MKGEEKKGLYLSTTGDARERKRQKKKKPRLGDWGGKILRRKTNPPIVSKRRWSYAPSWKGFKRTRCHKKRGLDSSQELRIKVALRIPELRGGGLGREQRVEGPKKSTKKSKGCPREAEKCRKQAQFGLTRGGELEKKLKRLFARKNIVIAGRDNAIEDLKEKQAQKSPGSRVREE